MTGWEKLKNKIYLFYQGRYGMDSLNGFLQFIWLIFFVVFLLSKERAFLYLGLCLLLMVNYRGLSKNLGKRQEENRIFLQWTSPLRRFFYLAKRQAKEWKSHRYLSCPHCKEVLRLPKNKGKIRITCPKCQQVFVKRV